jgi:hypothetical protein
MVAELDVYRTARVLIRQHGADAPIHAAMRHDALLSTVTWKERLSGSGCLLRSMFC